MDFAHFAAVDGECLVGAAIRRVFLVGPEVVFQVPGEEMLVGTSLVSDVFPANDAHPVVVHFELDAGLAVLQAVHRFVLVLLLVEQLDILSLYLFAQSVQAFAALDMDTSLIDVYGRHPEPVLHREAGSMMKDGVHFDDLQVRNFADLSLGVQKVE